MWILIALGSVLSLAVLVMAVWPVAANPSRSARDNQGGQEASQYAPQPVATNRQKEEAEMKYLPDGTAVLVVGEAGVSEHDGSALVEVYRLSPTEIAEAASLAESKPEPKAEPAQPEQPQPNAALQAENEELKAKLAELEAAGGGGEQ